MLRMTLNDGTVITRDRPRVDAASNERTPSSHPDDMHWTINGHKATYAQVQDVRARSLAADTSTNERRSQG